MSPVEPYLSIVVVARNDNYGGDFTSRLQTFVTNTIGLCDRERLDSELILVEWNPPCDRPPLREAVDWEQPSHCRVRIVTVPDAIHASIENPAGLALFEFIGKNTGIRRARGTYVLSTNADIVFGSGLIEFLAKKRLRAGSFYRIDRRDVRAPLPPGLPIDRVQRYCRRNVVRVHRYWASYDRRPLHRCWPIVKFFLIGLRDSPPGAPHTNASGDFLLMHREHWLSLRGYPELERKGRAHHIDSLLVLAAGVAGLEQAILRGRKRLYHQDHGRPEAAKPASADVARALEELRLGRRIAFNDEAWGLGTAPLLEAAL